MIRSGKASPHLPAIVPQLPVPLPSPDDTDPYELQCEPDFPIAVYPCSLRLWKVRIPGFIRQFQS